MAENDKKRVDDFLSQVHGRPVTLDEIMIGIAAKNFRRSWSEQEQPIRVRRRELLIAMVVELVEIRKTTIQATAFCEMAIEDVIVGDFDGLRSWVEVFEFKRDDDDRRGRLVPLFARFKLLCWEAADFLENVEAKGIHGLR